MSSDPAMLSTLVGIGVTQVGRLIQGWSQQRSFKREIRALRESLSGIYRRVGRVEKTLDLTPSPLGGRRPVSAVEEPLEAFDRTNPGVRAPGRDE